MTLATLFLVASWILSAATSGAATGQEPAPAAQNQAETAEPQNSQPPVQSPPQAAPRPHKSRTAKHRPQKKKPATSPCTVSGGTGPNSANTAGVPSSSNPSVPATGSAPAPKDCPPPKIVVRQGGTADPSIQLAGGPGTAQGSSKKDEVNQLLGATQENLKKIAGQPLSTNEQDTATQIRQFMDQSKAAIADGNLERARTLAWKAKTLSEDLVGPEK